MRDILYKIVINIASLIDLTKGVFNGFKAIAAINKFKSKKNMSSLHYLQGFMSFCKL